MTESLLVVLYGETVGTLERLSRHSEPTFSYDETYLSTGSTPLSVRLPLSAQTYGRQAIVPFIEGLLPENPDTRARWASRLGTDQEDTFTLLSVMGWDCPGAVQFSVPDELPEMVARSSETVPVSELDIGERLRGLREDSASWSLPEEHWSLPGQQDKFALVRADSGWHAAHGSAATTHIFKPGIGRLHHHALVEHATMRAADRVGVDVAHTSYQDFDDEPAIVVERFDRIVLPDGQVLRLHQEDFCQASGRLPARKYEEDQGPRAADMVRIIGANSRDRDEDSRALADFLIINYVAGAPDGHSKNISLTLRPDGIFMAPLYDLASAFPYGAANPAFRRVALSIGGRRDLGQVMAKNWDKAAEILKLPAEWMRTRARHVAEAFPDAFSESLGDIGTPQAADIRARSMDLMAAHCADLVRGLG